MRFVVGAILLDMIFVCYFFLFRVSRYSILEQFFGIYGEFFFVGSSIWWQIKILFLGGGKLSRGNKIGILLFVICLFVVGIMSVVGIREGGKVSWYRMEVQKNFWIGFLTRMSLYFFICKREGIVIFYLLRVFVCQVFFQY